MPGRTDARRRIHGDTRRSRCRSAWACHGGARSVSAPGLRPGQDRPRRAALDRHRCLSASAALSKSGEVLVGAGVDLAPTGVADGRALDAADLVQQSAVIGRRGGGGCRSSPSMSVIRKVTGPRAGFARHGRRRRPSLGAAGSRPPAGRRRRPPTQFGVRERGRIVDQRDHRSAAAVDEESLLDPRPPPASRRDGRRRRDSRASDSDQSTASTVGSRSSDRRRACRVSRFSTGPSSSTSRPAAA